MTYNPYYREDWETEKEHHDRIGEYHVAWKKSVVGNMRRRLHDCVDTWKAWVSDNNYLPEIRKEMIARAARTVREANQMLINAEKL